MPGMGPAKARQLVEMLAESGGDFSVWAAWKPPGGAAMVWPEMVSLLQALAKNDDALPAQVNRVRKFYAPAAGGELRSCRAAAARPGAA